MFRSIVASALALAFMVASARADISAPGVIITGVPSITTSCPASGPASGPITLNNGIVINAQTGTSYPFAATDCGKLVIFSNASAIAASLSAASTTGFNAPFFMSVQNEGAGVVTITPASGTIDGRSGIQISKGQAYTITSDSSNWHVQKTLPTPTRAGDIVYWNGSAWQTLAGNNSGTNFLQESSSGIPIWAAASGSCSGSLCAITAGSNWATAIGANLGSGWTTALAATYTSGGSCTGSFCSATAGSNWITALGATLPSNVATMFGNATNATGGALTQPSTWVAGNCPQIGAGGVGIADSGSPCGGSGGHDQAPGRIANLYYPLFPYGGIPATGGAPAGTTTAYCAPFWVDRTQTWLSLTQRYQTVGTTTVSLAIYGNGIGTTNGNNQPNGAPIATTTTSIANTANPIVWTFSSNSNLAANWQPTGQTLYWLCDMAGDTGFKWYVPSPSMMYTNLTGTPTEINGDATGQYSLNIVVSTYATWPTWTTSSAFTVAANFSVTPASAAKVVSVP